MDRLKRWMAIPDKTDGEPLIRLAAVVLLVRDAALEERAECVRIARDIPSAMPCECGAMCGVGEDIADAILQPRRGKGE